MSYVLKYARYICYHYSFFFFFNDTATTEIYTLSLHDALPICMNGIWGIDRSSYAACGLAFAWRFANAKPQAARSTAGDRKSTRLNSSHSSISYAVFCLKKKKNKSDLKKLGQVEEQLRT